MQSGVSPPDSASVSHLGSKRASRCTPKHAEIFSAFIGVVPRPLFFYQSLLSAILPELTEDEMSRKRASQDLLAQGFESLVNRLTVELEQYYGKRLISAVVFGSVGRGEPRADSDLDLLVIAKPLPNGRTPRVKEFAAVKEKLSGKVQELTKRGIFTSLAPIFKTPEEVNAGSLLFLDMINDGRTLYDRSGFWKSYMREFQERLNKLGAKRIVVGDRWYWDLKPDYKVGEVFEI